MYLLEQLANSPNDAVAITAQEILLRLSNITGIEISSDLTLREIKIDESKKLVHKKPVMPKYRPDTSTKSVEADVESETKQVKTNFRVE